MGINKRLSSISSSKEVFDNAIAPYQEALDKSGYKYKLEFDSSAGKEPAPKNNRKRNQTWLTHQ